MKRLILFLLIGTVSGAVFGQNERKFVRSGNKLFMEAVRDTTRLDTVRFGQAEEEYRKALNLRPTNDLWNFNLADALYKQMRFEEAEQKFKELSEKLETKTEQARALHNKGNSQLMQQRIDDSIESYKEALRRNPNDLDTKYNLAYAQMLKDKQEQQQQQQQNQQDQQIKIRIRIRTSKIRTSNRIRISKIRISNRIKTGRISKISSKTSSSNSKRKYHAKMQNSFWRCCKTTNAKFRTD